MVDRPTLMFSPPLPMIFPMYLGDTCTVMMQWRNLKLKAKLERGSSYHS